MASHVVPSGYGALCGDAHPTRAAEAEHEKTESQKASRSKGRLAAVGAGLLAAAVIITTLALISIKTPPGDDADLLAIPYGVALGAPPSPKELPRMSAPGLHFVSPLHCSFACSVATLLPLGFAPPRFVFVLCVISVTPHYCVSSALAQHACFVASGRTQR